MMYYGSPKRFLCGMVATVALAPGMVFGIWLIDHWTAQHVMWLVWAVAASFLLSLAGLLCFSPAARKSSGFRWPK
jgi:hypothetical protein